MTTTTYSKEEVQELIKEIIHQDSFGDVHYKAQQVARREGFDLSNRESADLKKGGE